ncbi:MAG: histidinol dehydrogenase [Anaerovoracaceae bacterium]|jgi:histidinol dehydrogenase
MTIEIREGSIIREIYTDGKKEYEILQAMKKRAGEMNVKINESVSEIIEAVREKGDEAVRSYGLQFDGAVPDVFEISRAEMEAAFENAEEAYKNALLRAKENITAYHNLQIEKDYKLEKENGVILGQIIRGLSRVGIYVPGGKAAYPSTVLMNAIPAKLAGVEEIIMITPPYIEKVQGQEPVCKANPDILAAAFLAGVDRVFLTGGAQAVAAVTYGTESIPRVDKIVGPGNIFVATAKKLLFGEVDIDMIAGPSEILIIADEEANPRYIAADLMSQAEHDELASSILLTTSEILSKAVKEELKSQLRTLDRKETIESSLKNFGAIVICKDMEEMINLANLIAPEHLELMVEEPMQYLGQIKNAGSVFCGEYSPEPLGDYLSGTNHVLPTSGTARFFSPLGVYSFVKKMSYTYYTKEALQTDKEHIVTIADKEGLDAHANSIKVRFE